MIWNYIKSVKLDLFYLTYILQIYIIRCVLSLYIYKEGEYLRWTLSASTSAKMREEWEQSRLLSAGHFPLPAAAACR